VGYLFTRLTHADIARLETLIQDCLEQLKLVKGQMKVDRARVARCERSFKEAMHQLITAAPLQVTAVDAVEEEEDEPTRINGVDKYEQRLRVPERG